MGRQKQLKKERKTQKMIESLISGYMVNWCHEYCNTHKVSFDDMDVFQKLKLVQQARAAVLKDIQR